jgi:uncharacterized DUF497 family protein
MIITYDQEKHAWTLAHRELDFERCSEVFGGIHVTVQDTREVYGEIRNITIGSLDGRMVIIVWTPRSGSRRIISMRKANDREQKAYAPLLRGG